MTIIPSPRVGHSLTAFQGGKKIVLFGGASFEEGYSNQVWVFDVEKEDWQLMNMSISSEETNEKGELQFPCARYEHSAQLIAEDRLAIFGGCGNEGLLNDLWLLDLSNWKYSKMPTSDSDPEARTIQSAQAICTKDQATDNATLEDFSLFVFGGGVSDSAPVQDSFIHIFDFKTKVWRKSNVSGPDSRFGHSMVPKGDYLYLFGGMNEYRSFNDLWQFDIKNHLWNEIKSSTSSPEGRGGHISTLTPDGNIFIHGGMNRSKEEDGSVSVKILGDCHYFVTESGDWINQLNDKDYGHLVDHAGIVLDKTTYLFGGMNETGVFEWESERVLSVDVIRLVHRGKFLEDNVVFTTLPWGEESVKTMHLVPKPAGAGARRDSEAKSDAATTGCCLIQ